MRNAQNQSMPTPSSRILESLMVTQENPWQNTTYLDGMNNQVSQLRSTMSVQGNEKQ